MKKVVLWVILISLGLGFGLIIIGRFTITPRGWEAKLINPVGQFRPTPMASMVPGSTPQAPPTFKFDSSTNLQNELDSINPQVLDSDFTDQ